MAGNNGIKNARDLLEWTKRMEAKAAARIEQKAAEQKANVVQLPMWPDPVRAVPNGFLRSALFGALAKGRRRFMKEEPIAAIDGIKIRYTGQQLDQDDLDVWENLVHAARIQQLGTRCRFTAYSLLKLMELSDSGKNRATLHTRLIRLKATAIEVQQGRYSYAGSLIDEIYQDEKSREYVVILNPKLVALFAADQFTEIDWAVRRELRGQPLAQWLHGFYASHAAPYPMRLETLLKLSGSENANPYSGKQKLRKALDTLARACAAHGERFSYEIRDGLMYISKRGSRSQQRHLLRKPRG